MLMVEVVCQCARHEFRQPVLRADIGQVVTGVGADRLIDTNSHPDGQCQEMLLA